MSSMDEADDVHHTDEEGSACNSRSVNSSEWIAHPRTLRLTTRPPLRLNSYGAREGSFTRISKSCNMPSIMFKKGSSVEWIAEKITQEALIPLFRKLHPEQSGWNLSLVNICATNMSPVATEHKDGPGRDIGRMFKRKEGLLKEWKFEDFDVGVSDSNMGSEWTGEAVHAIGGSEGLAGNTQVDYPTQDGFLDDDSWDIELNPSDFGEPCRLCGAIMPVFATDAHERFHNIPD